MNQQSTTASPANGASSPHELFALTDEQILEIEPEGEVSVAPGFSPASSPARVQGNAAAPAVIPSEPAQAGESRDRGNTGEPGSSQAVRQDSSSPSTPRNDRVGQGASDPAASEPPPWLAAQMKDPWSGEEARELWSGVMQTRQEAAAYRAAIPTPEDARALKELYPGGISEARAAAGRARLLEEIDGAYFGAAGQSPQDVSASRANLAQHLLREDPAAFREMVFAGLRVLEEAEKGSGNSTNAPNLPRLAMAFGAGHRGDAGQTPGIPAEAPASSLAAAAASELGSSVGARHAAPASADTSTHEAHLASYAAFEKAANEDLDRSIGAAIGHTIEQALPNLERSNRGEGVGARQVVPLHQRLGAAVRQDVEATLKGDRQLGEQIAQILSARRFDNETRAQVVRLINDRARQLVPGAAKRVINDWTQATLAAHRGSVARSDASSSRAEVATAAVAQGESLPVRQAGASPGAFSSRASQTRPGANSHRNASRSDARGLDYRKLSDEQILEL